MPSTLILLVMLTALAAALCCPACAVPSSGTASRGDDEDDPDVVAGAVPLRVMSVNVRVGTASDGANAWPERRALLLRTIRAFEPDLLGAQEVLDFQAEAMNEALPGHTFVGVGRDDGGANGEFSPVFYRTDRFEHVEAGHFWLSKTPEKPGSKSWDSALPRLATLVKLRDRRNDHREFIFLNTHWDHAGPTARLRSAELIRSRVEEMFPGAAVMLTGDFNCTEDDEPYAVLLGRGDDALTLLDSYRDAHPERQTDEATFHGFQGTVSGSRIDFILHSPQFKTTEAHIDRARDGDHHPTDHYPVTALMHWAR